MRRICQGLSRLRVTGVVYVIKSRPPPRVTSGLVSTAALIVLAVALAILAVCVATVAVIASRALGDQPDPTPRLPGDDTAGFDAEFAEEQAFPNLLFAPEYLDRDGLTSLAAELDIEVDPIQIGWTQGEEQAAESGRALETRLTLPGVAEVAANVSAAGTTTTLSQQTVSVTKRRGFTPIVTEIMQALRERGQLRPDLMLLPENAAELGALADSLIIFYSEWGLSGLPPTPLNPTPSVGDQFLRAIAPQPLPTAPTPSQDQLLRDAADLLWRRTLEEIVAAKQRELAAIAEQGGVAYSLGFGDWRVASDESSAALRLYNSQLATRGAADRRTFNLNARAVLQVPLNPGRLTDPGRQRLTSGTVLPLAVFGRIGAYSQIDGTLMLHPIAVFSI